MREARSFAQRNRRSLACAQCFSPRWSSTCRGFALPCLLRAFHESSFSHSPARAPLDVLLHCCRNRCHLHLSTQHTLCEVQQMVSRAAALLLCPFILIASVSAFSMSPASGPAKSIPSTASFDAAHTSPTLQKPSSCAARCLVHITLLLSHSRACFSLLAAKEQAGTLMQAHWN